MGLIIRIVICLLPCIIHFGKLKIVFLPFQNEIRHTQFFESQLDVINGKSYLLTLCYQLYYKFTFKLQHCQRNKKESTHSDGQLFKQTYVLFILFILTVEGQMQTHIKIVFYNTFKVRTIYFISNRSLEKACLLTICKLTF